MRVKRYIVDTMPDAMEKIRSELGADAVILSTKDLKVGGFLGMFSKRKIEVIAASEENEKNASKASLGSRASGMKPPSSAPVIRPAVPDAYRKSAQMFAAAASEALKNPAPASSSLDADREEVLAAAASVKSQDLERQPTKIVTQHTPAAPLVGGRAEDGKRAAAEERLLDEFREMKLWIGQLAKQQNRSREMPELLHRTRNLLIEQDLDEELIDNWIESAYQDWLDSGKTANDEQLRTVLRKTVSSFLGDRIGDGIRSDTKIVYIAGPTGVGKTTTIAKLAADQIFRARKKVGFITADTYRISAIEQLRTYSSILNVPLEVVQSPGDVQRALQRLSDCDLILMDTAGRNYLNELHVAELHSLLNYEKQSETYLVLSLTSKSQDMIKITEHFSKYGLDKVIFTKLDETASVGPMYNLLQRYPLKASYIANGQNVPDDLLPVTHELMLDMILGAESS
ncbi:flagellar biosynthesis protein FlhF [Paenibacillus apis]|uniref:Flagellar biosynthesis protein FlhF n=1 Tax=Paenibacillus apis TaxID=1792174 RepID=A0A920CM89_9BACL|nr:flagellar biosynthesis protein FlhF [Paenibacillus apis]GIO41832.1 flagellar biosynthesis regulator FlhF [Paenibacillus apis]